MLQYINLGVGSEAIIQNRKSHTSFGLNQIQPIIHIPRYTYFVCEYIYGSQDPTVRENQNASINLVGIYVPLFLYDIVRTSFPNSCHASITCDNLTYFCYFILSSHIWCDFAFFSCLAYGIFVYF